MRLGLGLGFTRSAVIPATFSAPADQTLFTQSAGNTITTAKPSPVTADGVDIGSTSGSPASLTYTPASLDLDQTLATADDTRKIAVVAADNGSLWDFTTWSLTNLSVTSGQSDPAGGTSAYKVIATTGGGAKNYRMSKSATGTPATVNSSGEIWISPIGTLLPIFRFYPLNGYAEANPATKEFYNGGGGNAATIHVVETKVVSGRTWYRLWFRLEAGQALSTLFVDLKNDWGASGSNVDVASGEHGFYMYRPRYVDGTLPFYTFQRLSVYSTAAASGVQRWIYTNSPYEDVAGTYYVKVLLPDTYDAGRSTPYPLCVVCPVEGTPGTGAADELQVIKTAGYHNTYDTIFVSYSSSTTGTPWGGVKNDGTHNHAAILKSLPSIIREHYNASSSRSKNYLVGYSKGGWAAYATILQNPTLYGFAAAWDVPWSMDYATTVANGYGTDAAFGNEATFLLYQPYTTLPTYKSAVNDKTRLVISAGGTFTSQNGDMKTALAAQSINYSEVTGLTGVAHNALAAWMGPVFAALFAL